MGLRALHSSKRHLWANQCSALGPARAAPSPRVGIPSWEACSTPGSPYCCSSPKGILNQLLQEAESTSVGSKANSCGDAEAAWESAMAVFHRARSFILYLRASENKEFLGRVMKKPRPA